MKKIFIVGVLFLAILAFGLFAYFKVANKDAQVVGAKTLAVVISPIDYSQADLDAVKGVAADRELEIRIVSIQSGTAKSDQGEIRVDSTVSEIRPEEFAGVLYLGGEGMGMIAADESLQILVKKFAALEKPIGAVSEGILVLAKAGVLAGKDAGGPETLIAELETNGALYQNELVVISGSIITAKTEGAGEAFIRLDNLLKK